MKRFTAVELVDLTDWRPPPDPRDGATLWNWVSIGALVLGCVVVAIIAMAANGRLPW